MTEPYYDKPTLVGGHRINFDARNRTVSLLIHVNSQDSTDNTGWRQTYETAVFPESMPITKSALFALLAQNYPTTYQFAQENYFVEDMSSVKYVPITTDAPLNATSIRFRCDTDRPCFASAPNPQGNPPARGVS